MTTTREQQLIARIAELEAENQTLRNRIVELEQQIAKLAASPASTTKTAKTVPQFVKPTRQKRRGKNRDTQAVTGVVPPKPTKLLKHP